MKQAHNAGQKTFRHFTKYHVITYPFEGVNYHSFPEPSLPWLYKKEATFYWGRGEKGREGEGREGGGDNKDKWLKVKC